MQCWVTSVISKRFAMLGSMLWVVFVVRSLCSFREVQHLISVRRMPENTHLVAAACQSVSSAEVALASVAFHDLPSGRHLHTEAHVQIGIADSGARKKALLVFLDILKLFLFLK